MAEESIYNYTLMGQYLNSLNYDRARKQAVASCIACGAKYRPVGGECLHEQAAVVWSQWGPVCCLACGAAWRPGHVC